MTIANADNANLHIVDRTWQQINAVEGVELLPSAQAWDQYAWTHQYFLKKPTQGYFVWIRQQPSCPVLSCVQVKQQQVQQDLVNLIVIAAGLTVELGGVCSAINANLGAQHLAQGKMVLRTGAKVEYQHRHNWGAKDMVRPHYDFVLEAGSKLNYTYQIRRCPRQLDLTNTFQVHEGAKVKLNIVADCQQTKFNSTDEIRLLGKNASGISNLRFVSREQAQIKARSVMVAQAAATGHLDCQSLNLAPSAQVELIPEIKVKDNQAQLTHEASIGKLSPQQLTYLQARGLSEAEAIELITSGFLQLS
jgi:hypothetical protein